MANNNNNDKFDINIQNISKQYGKLKAIKDEEDKLAQQKEKSKETTDDSVEDNLKQ
jgi:hypothetical protein